MALTRNVKPGDVLHLGGGITIAIERASGQRARLRITDPNDGPIRHITSEQAASKAADPGEEPPALTRSHSRG